MRQHGLVSFRLVLGGSAILLLASCTEGRDRAPRVPIVEGPIAGSTFQYCRIFYGPKMGGEPQCGERMRQCTEMLPDVIGQLQALKVPRRTANKCRTAARDSLEEKRRSDADFSLVYRSVSTGELRYYDEEAACLSRELRRTDIPSVRSAPAPAECAIAAAAAPASDQRGAGGTCETYPSGLGCDAEREAETAARSYDGRVTISLQRRCTLFARVDARDRPAPFSWSRYTACLKRSV